VPEKEVVWKDAPFTESSMLVPSHSPATKYQLPVESVVAHVTVVRVDPSALTLKRSVLSPWRYTIHSTSLGPTTPLASNPSKSPPAVGEKFTQNEKENELLPGEKSLAPEAKKLAPPEPGKVRAVLMMPADEVMGSPRFARSLPPAVASSALPLGSSIL
jgi:hypothetical protein